MSGVFRVDGDAYDDFMGRYSSRLAPLFADFAGVSSGVRVLDVGAGTGALTAELLARGASVAAADPSPEFAAVLRERFPDIEVQEAPAESLPFGAGVFDWRSRSSSSASCPTLRRRSPRWRGLLDALAVCMWGIAEVDMFARDRPNGGGDRRDARGEPRRYRTPQEIHDLLAPHGEVESAELDVTAGYRDFDEFWQAIGLRRRPRRPVARVARRRAAGAGVEELSRQLGSPEGPFELKARAFAAAVTPA